MSELREKVARVLATAMGEIGDDVWKFYLREADAAIALVRAETLEEAEKVAEDWAEKNVMDDTSWRDIKALIAAIRALKGERA